MVRACPGVLGGIVVATPWNGITREVGCCAPTTAASSHTHAKAEKPIMSFALMATSYAQALQCEKRTSGEVVHVLPQELCQFLKVGGAAEKIGLAHGFFTERIDIWRRALREH